MLKLLKETDQINSVKIIGLPINGKIFETKVQIEELISENF